MEISKIFFSSNSPLITLFLEYTIPPFIKYKFFKLIPRLLIKDSKGRYWKKCDFPIPINCPYLSFTFLGRVVENLPIKLSILWKKVIRWCPKNQRWPLFWRIFSYWHKDMSLLVKQTPLKASKLFFLCVSLKHRCIV